MSENFQILKMQVNGPLRVPFLLYCQILADQMLLNCSFARFLQHLCARWSYRRRLRSLLLWACVHCHVWRQLFERNYFPLPVGQCREYCTVSSVQMESLSYCLQIPLCHIAFFLNSLAGFPRHLCDISVGCGWRLGVRSCRQAGRQSSKVRRTAV